MSMVKCNQIEFDFERACYDLALVYAKSKLDESLRLGLFKGAKAPAEIEQMEYLSEEFYSAIGYFANQTVEYVKYCVDRE